ncbi:MAG: AraC family transcriptional regulator, partial [Bacteroidetes bacterium]|nr:AraC family transcriptional regulator [Bacteroidota bacterium]
MAFFVYVSFQSDLGEQYLMLIPLSVILGLSVLMMSGMPIFNKAWLLEKYHTSGLNISSSDILQEIIAHVEAEKYYLKSDGSLKDLAEELSLSPTYLSQIINTQAQQNFNDFINYYRIEEAKKRLMDKAYSHLSISGIGATVGFNSKSSFYSVFKKHTQLTPTAYIQSIKAGNSAEISTES